MSYLVKLSYILPFLPLMSHFWPSFPYTQTLFPYRPFSFYPFIFTFLSLLSPPFASSPVFGSAPFGCLLQNRLLKNNHLILIDPIKTFCFDNLKGQKCILFLTESLLLWGTFCFWNLPNQQESQKWRENVYRLTMDPLDL
jgi:hypothetical protein